MTIPIIATNTTGTPATGAQSMTTITKADFIRQGYDIVNAYAERYRLTALQPCNGPGRLADYIWKRYADENGTIPLLPEYIAVRLSNGHVRIMERDSDSERLVAAYPVADPIVDAIDSYPPIEPPELDETHVLPKPFQRSKDLSSAAGQLVHFPSFPGIDDDQLSEQFGSTPPSATPKLEYVYPPRGPRVFGPNGEDIGHEKPPPRWIIKMIDQARQRRQHIQQMHDDAKVELASTLLELQKARNDLDSSVVESQKTVDKIRAMFGTQCAFKVLNAKEEIEKKAEGVPNEGTTQTDSSYYDEENDSGPSESRPYSWPSRNWPGSDNHGVIENGVINSIANNSGNNIEMSDAHELALVLSSPVRKPTDGTLSSSPHIQSKYFTSLLGKRAREEDLDSETEVEASILYDGDGEETASPKKVRLDEAGTSIRAPSSRRSSLKRSHDMDVDKSRYTHRVRFAEPTSGPQSSSKAYHGQTTTPESPPRSKASRKGAGAPSPRRPLTRSTSQLLPAEDGGLYYVKYFPPRSKESSRSREIETS